MVAPTVTNRSPTNTQRHAAQVARPVQDQTAIRPAAAANLPANRQAILQAAAGRERVMANLGPHTAQSSLQPILDAWANTRPRVSFTSLMANRGGINATDSNGKTLAEVALANPLRGGTAIVRALKVEGADLELPDEDGNRLLHRAVIAGDVEGVKILLQNEVDADAFNLRTTPAIARYAQSPANMREAMRAPNWTWGDEDKATPLHFAAAFSNNPALIDALAWYVSDIDPRTTAQDTPLLWASIFSSNPEMIRELVCRGADVNIRVSEGRTLLHIAGGGCIHPQSTIPTLIEQGTSLEARDDGGHTALHHAAASGDHRACTALVASGADIHARANDNATPAELAVRQHRPGAAAAVSVLKAAGADLALPDADGNTLLHRTVMRRNLAGIEILYLHHVHVNLFNTRTGPTIRLLAQPQLEPAAMERPGWIWGNTDQASPIHLAAAFGNDPQLIHRLVAVGANRNAINQAQDHPLHWAATFCDNPDVITALIQQGAARNGAESASWTPLDAACANTRNPLVALELIACGAEVNPTANRLSPAECAIRYNPPVCAAVIPALKQAGANFELADADGNRLLHQAVMRGHLASIEAVLASGVEVNARNIRMQSSIANHAPDPGKIIATIKNSGMQFNDRDKVTPLHLAAAFSNNPALIQLLVQYGANVHARSDDLEDPLGWAAAFATNPEVIDALIHAGGDIRTTQFAGLGILQAAAMANPDPRMIDKLVQYGASIEPTDRQQRTPLQLAALQPTQTEVVRALIRHGAHIEAGREEMETPLELATKMSLNLEISAILRTDLNIDFADDSSSEFSVQRYLESGISNNIDIMIALIEAGGNSSVQRRLAEEITKMIEEIREDCADSDNADWSPEQRQEFLNRFDTESSLTLAALQHRPMVQSDVATPLRQLEQLRISQTQQVSGSASQSAASTAAAATRQRQLADLPRLLANPLVREVTRWYSDTDRTVQAARASAWHAINAEPHVDEFQDFVAHLNQTAEYRHPQQRPDYVRRVAQLLTAIQNSSELRQQCFLLVEDATSSCGDRVGLTLNNLDMARIEHEAEHGQHSAQDLINIRTSQFRIQVLGEVAQRKIAALRPTLGNRLDEIEVIHGAITLVAEELNLIGVSRTMLYGSYAHFSDDDKRNALALIAQRENRGEYVKFIAEWQPWQKQLRRMRPNDFTDLDQRVAAERDTLSEQPAYTSDNDYVELCRQMETMQRTRLTFSLENWTREWLVQNRRNAR